MGNDALCNVSRYADNKYHDEVPRPSAFPKEGGADGGIHTTASKHAMLMKIKADLLAYANDNADAAPIHADPTRKRTAAMMEAIVERIYEQIPDDVDDGIHAHSVAAAHQRLVDAFLLDGSDALDGRTFSGYPIFGHRTAEERLKAIREALYHGTWQAKPFLPNHNNTNNSNSNNSDVHSGPETREQYWRRLAQFFVHQHTYGTAMKGSNSNNNSTTDNNNNNNDGEAAGRDAATAATAAQQPCEPEDPFYLLDLGRVVEQMALWRRCLPMVRPHFAVKCNPNPAIIEVLAACGAGFDCASKAEIDMILKGGKNGPGSLVAGPDDIIFANPCKQPGDLKAAAAANVNYVTFDSAGELEKIARYMPNAKAVLRISTNDAKAACAFSVKFGAPLDTVDDLLDAARRLNVEIYGVSFHVGSGNGDPSAYTDAVRNAHRVFQMAAKKGFNCTLLDIGGGFPGTLPTPDAAAAGALRFEEIAAALRPVLEELFPYGETTIIGEPGRYFTAATHALVMQVFASRTLRMSAMEQQLCRGEFRRLVKEKKALDARAAGRTSDDDKEEAEEEEEELFHFPTHNDGDDGGDNNNNEGGEEEAGAARDAVEEVREHQYYVNDGLYGSFNCIIFDHAAPTLLLLDDGDGADAATGTATQQGPSSSGNNNNAGDNADITVVSTAYASSNLSSPLSTGPARSTLEEAQLATALARRTEAPRRPLRVTTIYGPTCDSMDCILKKKPFPEMRVGDWLLVPDMGSYTTAAGCAFNGFATRHFEWICSVDI